MSVSENEKQELIREARLYALVAPTLYPLLEKRKRIATQRLLQQFKEGETEFIGLVAEINVLTDIEHELKQKEAIFNTLEAGNGNSAR